MVPVKIIIKENNDLPLIKLHNKLIINNNYYNMLSCNTNSIVTKYKKNYLELIDFITLYNNQYLTSVVIDYLFNVCYPLTNGTFVSVSLSTCCLNNDFTVESPIVNLDLFKGQFTFLINVVNNNHYVLIYLNNYTKQIFYYDPLGKNELDPSTARKVKFLIKTWCTLKNCTEEFYELAVAPKMARQKDGFNWGIFCTEVVRRIAIGMLCDDIDPEACRNTYRHDILMSSEDMTNVCLYCGREDESNDVNWVQCQKCERWIHQSCTSLSLSTAAWNSLNFNCKLCEDYKG